jgi:hypothetical protein
MGEGAQLQRECGASQPSGRGGKWWKGKRERELAAWPLGTKGDGALVRWDLVRGEGAGVYQ